MRQRLTDHGRRSRGDAVRHASPLSRRAAGGRTALRPGAGDWPEDTSVSGRRANGTHRRTCHSLCRKKAPGREMRKAALAHWLAARSGEERDWPGRGQGRGPCRLTAGHTALSPSLRPLLGRVAIAAPQLRAEAAQRFPAPRRWVPVADVVALSYPLHGQGRKSKATDFLRMQQQAC